MADKKIQALKNTVRFTTTILQFGEQGEKTGWTYIEIPADIAQQLKPGNKKSFRVKGKLDDYAINGIALMPMGSGKFIMAVNASMRKGMGKRKGALLQVQLQADDNFKVETPQELLDCLADEPPALANFNKLSPSHRGYYIKWIMSAKTEQTITKRIVKCITAMKRGMHYGQMLQSIKADKDELML